MQTSTSRDKFLFMIYLRKMLDTAWEWADKHHKKRRNAVHGEEEICCILDDEFLFRAENGESMSMNGQFSLEEWCRDIYYI